MNREEAIEVCRLAKTISPSQPMDDYTPDAWALILRKWRKGDALLALEELGSNQEWIHVSHVVKEIKRIRRNRVLAYGTPPDPPATLNADDPQAYAAFLARTNEQIADGQIVRAEDDRAQLPRRNIRELGQAGKAIDARDAIEAARMRVQETEGERVAERDAKQRRIEEMRASDRNARSEEGTDQRDVCAFCRGTHPADLDHCICSEDQRAAEGWAS